LQLELLCRKRKRRKKRGKKKTGKAKKRNRGKIAGKF